MGLPKDYQQRLSTVQASLKSAYTRLPIDIQSTVNPSGTVPVDYFLAQAVADILKSQSERTLFGHLQGDAGLWQKLVLAYQRSGVANSGSLMLHSSIRSTSVNYDKSKYSGAQRVAVQVYGQLKLHIRLYGA